MIGSFPVRLRRDRKRRFIPSGKATRCSRSEPRTDAILTPRALDGRAGAQEQFSALGEIKLPCVPEIERRGTRVAVKNLWLCTGVHNAVMLGFIELFVNDLVGLLFRCRWCDKFFLAKTKKIVVCSPQCWKKRRTRLIASYVKRSRRKRKKEQQGGGAWKLKPEQTLNQKGGETK